MTHRSASLIDNCEWMDIIVLLLRENCKGTGLQDVWKMKISSKMQHTVTETLMSPFVQDKCCDRHVVWCCPSEGNAQVIRYQSRSGGEMCLIQISLVAGQFIGKQELWNLIISGKVATFFKRNSDGLSVLLSEQNGPKHGAGIEEEAEICGYQGSNVAGKVIKSIIQAKRTLLVQTPIRVPPVSYWLYLRSL